MEGHISHTSFLDELEPGPIQKAVSTTRSGDSLNSGEREANTSLISDMAFALRICMIKGQVDYQ
ncbi:MAG: hypothetical protein QOE55_6926 [Acidobacteriaceae bacterium]|nr:hypothetical protein [Acidobacteriaceae bacterium]